MKSSVAEFQLNEPFMETTIDGRRLSTTFSIVVIGCKDTTEEHYGLLQSQVDSSGRNIQIIRFIRNEQLNVLMKVQDIVALAISEYI